MRSGVMGSPFWILKAFPRAVMMLVGFCGADVAGDSDEVVAIACRGATAKRAKQVPNIRGNNVPCLVGPLSLGSYTLTRAKPVSDSILYKLIASS